MYRPPLCSEREVGGYEDCSWCAGVMLQNAAQGAAAVPSTRAEYEALRVAGGDGPAENPGDGSNLLQVQVGFSRRYDWVPNRIGVPGLYRADFEDVWARLTPGIGGAIQGLMGSFHAGHRLRRWDYDFRGAHCVYVQRETSADRVWWMDPLAPSTYDGEWVTKSDLRTFFNGLLGGFLYAEVGQFALPDTDTEEPDDVRDFTLLYGTDGRLIAGSLVVRADPNIKYLDLSTGTLHGPINPVAFGTKQAIRVRLKEPMVAGKPDTDEWRLGYLIGDDAAFLLSRNVVFTQYPSGGSLPASGTARFGLGGATYSGTVTKQ